MRGLILVALSLSVFSSALGAELLVPSEYETIQAGIDAAVDGDVVIVADGTYKGYRNCGIYFAGKAITVKSESGPDNCIMDCNAGYYHYQGCLLGGGEDSNSVLEGFTIINGRGGFRPGGGISISGGSATIVNCIITSCSGSGIYIGGGSPTIRDCNVSGSWAEDGGGICIMGGSPNIIDCIITGNTAHSGNGGGIYCEGSSATISGCRIAGNTVTEGVWSSGGGIYCEGDNGGAAPVIVDCTITGNSSSGEGGGVSCCQSEASITGCTISDNSADHYGGGIHCGGYFCGGSFCGEGEPVISGCVISGNSSGECGGGINYYQSSGVVSSCVISENQALDGGGVAAIEGSNATLINCTVADNVFTSYGAIGGIWVHESTAKITNCIVWGNSFHTALPFQIVFWDGASGEVTYCDVQGGFAGEGNIYASPIFLGGGGYRLYKYSPCVDAGDPNYEAGPNETDIDGEPRVMGMRVDMGADETVSLSIDLNMDEQWMYQSLPGQINSDLTAGVSITDDPEGNSSYSYEWEIILPGDVNLAPVTVDGGGAGDVYWTFAALGCDEPAGLSDSGQAFTVRVTITGDDYGNKEQAEMEFGIALLGDINNDGVVNVADRSIANAFWRTGSAGAYTLRDCDVNCDGAVNVADRSIVNVIWRGILGQNSVSAPCPLR